MMRARELFRRLGEQQKLSHAYLFSGNDKARKAELIGVAAAAAKIDATDQMVVEPAGKEITIAQVRSWTSFFSVSPWASAAKAGVVHDAHLMNREAQSAFLKLLEEPKGNVIFFLTTEYPDVLLETIRSRTQEVAFYAAARKSVDETAKRDFQNMQKANMHGRFLYAKGMSETPEELFALLDHWLAIARENLHTALGQGQQEVSAHVRILQTIQETLFLLRTTNVNPRLALERIMLDL